LILVTTDNNDTSVGTDTPPTAYSTKINDGSPMTNVNPYAPPSPSGDNATAAQAHYDGPRRHKSLRLPLVAYALAVFFGVAVAAYDIESIIGSGPILLLIGTGLAVIGHRRRDMPAVLLGMSSFLLAGLVVALINLVPYSPTTGYWPLLTIIGFYACVSLPITGWMLIFRRNSIFEVDGN